MKRVIVGLVLAGLVAAGLIVWFGADSRERDSSLVEPIAKVEDVLNLSSAPSMSSVGFIALTPPSTDELAGMPRSPLADALGAPGGAPGDEVRVVFELFQFYRREFGVFPAGEDNRQWMNALRGSNPERLPILPSDHPRLDENGALLDAWANPFFIHQIARDRIEVRSAGPDGALFTEDDSVFPSANSR